MSKSDQLRRMREQQHEQREQAAGRSNSATSSTATAEAPAETATDVTERTVERRSAKPGAAEETGRCAVCGKVRPLQNGLVSAHQKGLGKSCPGSRKEPG